MVRKKIIKILAIETSCDDTGIALVSFNEGKAEILSNIVSSQTEIHEQFGGVFPSLAKREHQKNLVPVLVESLKKANFLKIQNSKVKSQNDNSKLKIINSILEREQELLKQILPFLEKYEKPSIDYIAVTNGPGLEPCLWVGTNFAKVLALCWSLPIIPVDHIKAHIAVNWLKPINEISNSKFLISNQISNLKLQITNYELRVTKNLFPAVCLVVSGGHTQIILMKNFNKFELLGETRDDAAGECFDKTARILGLGYPGGPAIAAEAAKFMGQPKIKLPRPMLNTNDYDFSFSGLKTAVMYMDKKTENKDENYVMAMAHEIQQAIIDVLARKTIDAAINCKAKTIILGGGVTANQELRKQVSVRIEKMIPGTKFLAPDIRYSTDNGLMIAITAYFNQKSAANWQKVEVNANLRIK